MRSVRLKITGRVQGVGFRWFAREQARRLGVRGWVRNRPDGAVEVEAAAEDDALDAFIERLRIGPSGANVAAVQELGEATGELPDPFTIDRQRQQ